MANMKATWGNLQVASESRTGQGLQPAYDLITRIQYKTSTL